ncbi:unnamed protein product [Ilex paraguariensis]|uniref:Transmembrane protein n=1 Tax=Ilex paraguariensis TaxID=185542 RepID=A0ABC8V515_9AQUA
MASSSSSKPIHLSWHLFYILSFLFLLIGSCLATRTGKMMMVEVDGVSEMWPENLTDYPRKTENVYPYPRLLLNKLPKGVPIPPSGPSKGHNSMVNSEPPS